VQRGWRLAGACACALALTACIGSIDRTEFEAEIDARGGGISSALVADAFDAVRARLGVADFETDGVYVSSQLVTMDVRDPIDRDAMDSYAYRLGSLDDPRPVRVSASDAPLDATVFPVSEVPVDALDLLVAITLRELDIARAVPQSIAISRRALDGGPVEIRVSVESVRASGSATFDTAGDLIEVQRS
jgi:hypothetical protein